MRSAAGGETGAPRSQRGTRLKATTERAFLDHGAKAGRLKRLVLLCQQCGTGSPSSGPRQQSTWCRRAPSWRAGRITRGSPRRPSRRSGLGARAEMTARIREFLKRRKDEGPCLVVDLDVVRENYLAFAKALPDSKVFYAIKANPAPEILELLASLGCCFDVASVNETQAALAAGATPDRISYGNTIKKEADIASAFALGVTL